MKSFRLIDKASWLVAMLFNSQLVMACLKTANVEMPRISALPTTTGMPTTTCPPTTGCSLAGIPDQEGAGGLTVTLVTSQTGSCPSLAVTCTKPGLSGLNIALFNFLAPTNQFTCPNPVGCVVCPGATGCPVQCVNGRLMFTDTAGTSQTLVSLDC